MTATKQIRTIVRLCAAVIVTSVLFVGTAMLRAAVTWNGATDASWDTASNWSGGSKPVGSDDVVFPSSAAGPYGPGSTVSLSGGEVVNRLTFDASYTLENGTLQFGTAAQPASGPATLTLAVNGAGTTATINSNILNVPNNWYLAKSGSGTLVLGGDNHLFNKWADVYSGTVVLTNGLAGLGPSGYFHVTNAGARVQLQGGITTNSTGIYLSGSATNDNASLQSVSGTNTWGGYIQLNGAGDHNVGVDASSTLTITGDIKNSGNLVKVGAGTLIVQGVNSYAGSTQVKDGTLQLVSALPGTRLTLGSAITNTSGTLDLNGKSQTVAGLYTAGSGAANRVINSSDTAGSLTINLPSATTATYGGALGAGANTNFSLTISGSGTQVLSGSSTYTGTGAGGYNTQISSGTLQLGADNALPVGGSLRIDAGGTWDLNGHSQTISVLSTPGHATIKLGAGTLTVSSGDFGAPGSVCSGEGGVLRKTGDGELTFSPTSTYTGGTIIDGGMLSLYSHDNTLPSSGDVTINGTGKLNLAYSALSVQNIGGLLGASTTAKVSIGASGAAVNFVVGNGDRSGNFAGVIENGNGILSLTKTGAGTQVLAGVNTYTGDTTINAGTLKLGNTSALGTTAGKTTVNSGGTLDLNGQSTSEPITLNGGVLSSSVGGVYSGALTLNAGTNYINNPGYLTITGKITGAGGFTKTSGSSVALTNPANDFQGPILAHSGWIDLGANEVIPDTCDLTIGNGLNMGGHSETIKSLSGAAEVAGGGTVTLTLGANDGSGNYSGRLYDNGGRLSLAKIGSGTQILRGTSDYSGTTTISGGTLLVNGTHTGGGSYAVAGGTLGGTGTIATKNANVTVGAGSFLSPGASAGVLTLGLGSGTLDLSSIGSGALVFELGATDASDKVVLTSGILDIGTLDFTEFDFQTLPGSGLGTYTLFDAATAISGTIGVANGTVAGYHAVLWIDAANNDVLLSVVPEPSAIALLGLGLLGLLGCGWRRKR
jgi:autotransporter-associated beta strand protein